MSTLFRAAINLGLCAALLCPATAAAQNLPEGFSLEPVMGGLSLPIAFDLAWDGTPFVATKDGQVWTVDEDGAEQLVLDVSEEVNGQGDRGLVGFALHPDFEDNGWIYLLYTVDPITGEPDESATSATWGRLERWTLHRELDHDSDHDHDDDHDHDHGTSSHHWHVEEDSRIVLLGDTAADGPAACSVTHHVGSLRFGPDGSLYLSAGEGAHFDYYADIGQDLSPEDADCSAMFPDTDLGALRSQANWSLNGKVLRIDPITGLGLPNNPLYTGDPDDVQSRIWATGLRNPWRFSVDPLGGWAWIGDVGESRWEELNFAAGGQNFGWPCREGITDQPQYLSASPPAAGCDTIGGPTNPGALTDPLLAWSHGDPALLSPSAPADALFTGSTAMAGPVYTGSLYPEDYIGVLFFADFTEGWLRTADVMVSGDGHYAEAMLMSVDSFGDGMPGLVDMGAHPVTGDLYLLNIYNGGLFRLRHDDGSDRAPVPVLGLSATTGPAPFSLVADASDSLDPEGEALTFAWSWGDGGTDVGPVASHVYESGGAYTLTLTVSDPAGNRAIQTARVLVDRSPPEATILAPLDGANFTLPNTFSLIGQGSDTEDDSGALRYDWSVDLYHNTHYHPGWRTLRGAEVSLPVAAIDENGHMVIHLTVTDSDGLTATDSVAIYPSNRPPVVSAPTGVVGRVGSLLSLPLTIVDPEGDGVDIDAISLPAGASLDVPGRRVLWTPTSAQVGFHRLQLRVSDTNPAPMTADIDVEVEILPSSSQVLSLVLTSDWGGGYCGDLSWTNDTGGPVRDWAILMGLRAEIFASWSGTFSPVFGGYLIEPVWYNEELAPGAALNIGFCAAGPAPDSVELILPEVAPEEGLDLLITYTEWGRWGAASCGDVSVRNNEPLPIIGWRVGFELPAAQVLTSYWLAEVAETAPGSWLAVDEGWNAYVDPVGGEPAVFGLCTDGPESPDGFTWAGL